MTVAGYNLWPSWWCAVPVGVFILAFLLTVVPVRRDRPKG